VFLRRVKSCRRSKIFRKIAVSKLDRCRLSKEAQILDQVRHPRIPRLLDFTERAAASELQMEQMPGIPLSRALHSRLNVPNICLEQIADAIRHLHKLGWNHSDIKPANILIEGANAYLVDFNAASPHGEHYSQLSERSFSPSFAAWKQLTGCGAVSVKDDLFSLELTRFVTFARRHPFEGQSVAEFFSLGADYIYSATSVFSRPFRDRVLEEYEEFLSETEELPRFELVG